jgi:hypothetical protein
VKLQYHEQYSVSCATTGTIGFVNKTFQINNPYDPYPGFANLSAGYWTFWSSVYGYYHTAYAVFKPTITFVNAPTNPCPGRAFVTTCKAGDFPTLSNSDNAGNYCTLKMIPYVKYKNVLAGYGSDNQIKRFKIGVSPYKILGRKYDPSLDNSTVSAGPTESVYCVITLLNNGATSLDTLIDVVIDYYIVFNKLTIKPDTF